jgi:hypothetical protein
MCYRTCMASFLYLFIWLPIITIIRGVVLSTMWSWFIVPLGVKPIGVAWAVGISVIVAHLTLKVPDQEKQPDLVSVNVAYTILMLLLLLMGAVAHYFMHY